MFILKLRLLVSFEGNTLATSSGVVNFAVPLGGAAQASLEKKESYRQF
jgi:hypothetical protein